MNSKHRHRIVHPFHSMVGSGYALPAPTYTSVAPTSGTAAGGTSITVTGTDFVSGANVYINNELCSSIVFNSSTELTAVTPLGLTVGAKDLKVRNPDGQYVIGAGEFTYTYSSPTISSVSPTNGKLAGGTSITITGTNYYNGRSSVTVDSTAATSVVVNSATEIVCLTPAKTAGAKDVAVTVFGQTATSIGAYTYNPFPTVTSLNVTSGTTVGGTAIVITGTGFLTGATVTAGEVSCTGVSVDSSTQISCTTGAHGAGVVDVVVTNADTQSGTKSAAFTYSAPTFSSISPNVGSLSGGTAVVITGNYFASGATVTIGGVNCTGVSVDSATQISCTTGAHAAGVVNVVVTNTDATNCTGTNAFTYQISERSLAFGGTDEFAYTADSAALSPTNNLSLCCWVKTSRAGTAEVYMSKWGYGAPVANQRSYTLEKNAGNKMTWYVSETGSGTFQSVISSKNITDGNWHFYVATYASGTMKLYIDGIEDTNATQSGAAASIYDGTAELMFGAQNDHTSAGGFAIASIKGAAIWGTSVLTAAEALTLYNNGVGLDPTSNSGNYTSSGDLISYWPINDSDSATGTIYDAHSSADLTCANMESGDLSTSIPAWSNTKSYVFDGTNEYCEVANTTDHNFSTGFSTSLWLKTTNTGAQKCLVSKYAPGSNNRSWFVELDANDDIFVILSGDGLGGGSTKILKAYATPSVNIFDGNWHHIAVTADCAVTPNTDAVTIYVDGQAETTQINQSTGWPFNLYAATAKSVIASEDVPDIYFNGSITQVLLYNRELSSAEVTTLYGGGSAVNPLADAGTDDYVSYYPMGDHFFDSETIMIDLGSGMHHMTPTNMEAGDVATDAP